MDPIQAITNLKQIQQLIHLIARAYYDTREILVLDLLLYNDYMQDTQLSSAVGIQSKELQKICGRLKSHGMVKILSRWEEIPYGKDYIPNPNQEKKERRKINRTYYYIDYGLAVNSIKYKVYQIQKMLDSQVTEISNQYPYKCTGCGKVYAALEMLSLELNLESGMYMCEIDYADLDVDSTPDTAAGNAHYVKFMIENAPIVELLKRADNLYIPESNPHLPDPTAMIPTSSTPDDQDTKDSSTIKVKQGTMAPQNQIIVEIEESGAGGNTGLDIDAADDIQAYYASLATNEEGPPASSNVKELEHDKIVMRVSNANEEEEESDDDEFEEI